MVITLKNILLIDKSLFTIAITAVIYIVLVISLIYGLKKYSVAEIIKSPPALVFLFLTLSEAALYIFQFPHNEIFYINSGIFIMGVIISLIDERYYSNRFPVTICRISIYIIGVSVLLIVIEIIYILLIMVGSLLLILLAVWSAVDFDTFKKKILFWRNRT